MTISRKKKLLHSAVNRLRGVVLQFKFNEKSFISYLFRDVLCFLTLEENTAWFYVNQLYLNCKIYTDSYMFRKCKCSPMCGYQSKQW